jgi:hypothetical protein
MNVSAGKTSGDVADTPTLVLERSCGRSSTALLGQGEPASISAVVSRLMVTLGEPSECMAHQDNYPVLSISIGTAVHFWNSRACLSVSYLEQVICAVIILP